MTIKEYIKKLEEGKALAVNSFGNLTVIERQVVDLSFEWLIENIPLKTGNFEVTENISAQMNDFVNAVLRIVDNNGEYQNQLINYLTNITTIGYNITQFQSTSNNIDLKKAGLTPIQNGVVSEIINAFTENGLNAGFVQPLRDLVFRNLLAGMSVREAKTYLNDYILSGKDTTGKLARYVTQTAQQGVDSYTGAIHTKLANTFKFTGYIISGSLIETSSEQCVYAVRHADATGYLSNKEWNKILEIAKDNKKARLIDGTDLTNLDQNKLHWGCRHTFTPSIKK